MLERFERFSLAMAEVNKHWHKLVAEEMEKYGLKGAHCVYLLALSQSTEGLTTPQLCESCGKDKADASRMMRSLEEKGLVTKKNGPQTRYGGTFVLTEKGIAAATHIQDRACRAVEYAGADLSIEQRNVFYSSLEAITARLRELSKDGIPTE